MVRNFADSCVMQWEQRQYTKTILYVKNTNTPTIYSVPRTPTFRANLQLCDKVAKTCQIAQTLAFCATSAKEQLQKQSDVKPTKVSQEALKIALSLTSAKAKLQKQSDENITDFLSTESIPNSKEVDQNVETSALTLQGEFLRWHRRLGHLSYKKMVLLCTLRILPRRLLTVRPPMCTSCKAGSM